MVFFSTTTTISQNSFGYNIIIHNNKDYVYINNWTFSLTSLMNNKRIRRAGGPRESIKILSIQ